MVEGRGWGGVPVVGRLGWTPFWMCFVVVAWGEQLVDFAVVVFLKRGHGFGRLDAAALVCESRRCCRGSRPRVACRGMSMGDMTKGTKTTPGWGDADYLFQRLFPLLGSGIGSGSAVARLAASMVRSRDEDGRMDLDGCQAGLAIGCSWCGGPRINDHIWPSF